MGFDRAKVHNDIKQSVPDIASGDVLVKQIRKEEAENTIGLSRPAAARIHLNSMVTVGETREIVDALDEKGYYTSVQYEESLHILVKVSHDVMQRLGD